MDKPKRLYKYQPVSIYSLRNLKNNHIYFNDPSDFNDPFDTFHEVKIGRLAKDAAKDLYFGQGGERLLFERIEQKLAKKEEILQILALLFKTFKTFKINLLNLLNFNENDFLNKSPQDVLKERSVNNELYEFIIKSFYSSLDSTIDESLRYVREENMNNKGISCFSTEFDNMLMWAYYADGHKGMCLEFNTEYDPFSKIHEVKYSKETPTVDANIILNDSTDHHEIIEAYLLSKYEDWSHEREWRIIHKQNRITFGYKSNALTGIYFGSKISFTDFEIIASIIKGQHSNCKFYQMGKVHGEFKIIPRELNYTTFQEAKNIVLKNIQQKLDVGVTDLNELIKDLNLATLSLI